jgi:hypothetical protein
LTPAEVHQRFADAVADLLSTKPLDIAVRQANNNAVAIHCDWKLETPGPNGNKRSRGITVQVSGAAVKGFCESPNERGRMLEKFSYILPTRLTEGGYNEVEASPPPFIAKI